MEMMKKYNKEKAIVFNTYQVTTFEDFLFITHLNNLYFNASTFVEPYLPKLMQCGAEKNFIDAI